MATRRYKFSPGSAYVTEEAGAAVNSDKVELTIELAAGINEAGATRTISREEVLEALEKIENWITTHNWPPA